MREALKRRPVVLGHLPQLGVFRNSDNGDEKDAFSARQAWPD